MRESLAKLKASLEQEKRLNASIKQKKVGFDDKPLFHHYPYHCVISLCVIVITRKEFRPF